MNQSGWIQLGYLFVNLKLVRTFEFTEEEDSHTERYVKIAFADGTTWETSIDSIQRDRLLRYVGYE